MGRGGHNVKPVDQHHLEGSYRKHRHADRLEIHTEAVEMLEIPEHFDKAMEVKFRQVCSHLAEFGLLTPADRDAIQCYIETLDLQSKAWQEVQQNGVMIDKDGQPATNPAMRVYLQCDAILKPLREKFAMTPKDRQSVKTKKAIKKELDPFAALLK